MTDKSSIRERASAALRQAMKDRDLEAVAAIRTLLAEFANAEATPSQARAGAIEDALGLGATEVERIVLTEADLTAIALREHDELGCVADDADARGAGADAGHWRRRQEVVARLLDR